jgi:DNA-binding response OmpR family regulator
MAVQKMRVLIVDDDPSMSRFLTSYLSRQNFDVNSASSGEEAIRMFRVYDPSLVLLDMNMTGIDGIETLERLKQIKPEVSVIVVSGQNSPDLIFRASKAGADDYINKPFDPKDLEARVHRVVERQRIST